MNAILITVRTGSTRLPNKAILEIEGKSTIEHLISRVKHSKLADKIILCTTELEEDNVLCEIAKRNNIECYRGSVKDKLDRWLGACNRFNIDFFVTADGDDLFCEPELIDLAFEQRKISQEDFIKSENTICGAFTYGISREALATVCSVKDSEDTEMMWTYFEDTGLVDISLLKNVPDEYIRNDIRMTLDYSDDFVFFDTVIKHFGNEYFSLRDIVKYIDKNPEVAKINLYLEDEWKKNQNKNTTLELKKDSENSWLTPDLETTRFNDNQYKEMYRSTAFIIDCLKDVLSDTKQLTVVDAGTGGGANLYYIAKKYTNHKFIGIDTNEHYLNQAVNSHIDLQVKNTDFQLLDVADTKNLNADIIGSAQVLNILDFNEGKDFIEKSFRNANKGVFIQSLFTDRNLEYDITIHDSIINKPIHYNIHSVSEIEKIANKHGFRLTINKEFIIDVDLPDVWEGRGTHTITTEDNKRLQFTDILYLPWKFLYFSK